MKIYRCDKCGHEEMCEQIRGREFDYKGFETLETAYRGAGCADLCATCFKALIETVRAAKLEQEEDELAAEKRGIAKFYGGNHVPHSNPKRRSVFSRLFG